MKTIVATKPRKKAVKAAAARRRPKVHYVVEPLTGMTVVEATPGKPPLTREAVRAAVAVLP